MWVIKFDGSLWNSRRLPLWLDQLACFGTGEVVVVPGAGPLMEQIRIKPSSWSLPDEAALPMTLHGMAQFAHLMAGLRRDLVVVDSPETALDALARGRVAVWAPSRPPDGVPPAASRPSCDSLAALLAERIQANCLYLVKKSSLESSPVSGRWLAERGLVDEAFPRALAGSSYSTWIGSVADHQAIRQMLYSRVVSGIPVLPESDKGDPS